jgi:hypothetical protein
VTRGHRPPTSRPKADPSRSADRSRAPDRPGACSGRLVSRLRPREGRASLSTRMGSQSLRRQRRSGCRRTRRRGRRVRGLVPQRPAGRAGAGGSQGDRPETSCTRQLRNPISLTGRPSSASMASRHHLPRLRPKPRTETGFVCGLAGGPTSRSLPGPPSAGARRESPGRRKRRATRARPANQRGWTAAKFLVELAPVQDLVEALAERPEEFSHLGMPDGFP